MKNTDEKRFITMGKLGSTYGVHGWLKIGAYTDHGPDLLDYSPWYLSKDGKTWKLADLEGSKEHGSGILAKFNGIDSPEEARLLTGMLIGIERSQMAELPEGEYYWTDLIGLNVIDKEGTFLGVVTYLMETGSNDVIIIKGDKEHAIPYLMNDVILSIDLEKKEIRVDWELI